MRYLPLAALIAISATAAEAQQALVPAAAEVIFPWTTPNDIRLLDNGNVRFKGAIAGADSELSAVPGRSCAFRNTDLRSNRVTYQVNFGQSAPDFATKPSRFGYAAIRLTGQGIYCSSDRNGVVCNDVYDITAWGPNDLTRKISALRKLEGAGCFKD